MSGAGEEALAQALSLQRDNPGAPDAYVLVGDVLDRNGRYAEAAETYRRAANLRFSEAVALRLVDTLRKGGQPLAAQQVLLLFVQQNPANVPARLLYADMMMARGSFLEAGRTLERIHRQRGYADVATTNNLAWCYFGVQRPLLAEAAAKRAYAMTPANASVSNSYGWLIYRTGGNRNDALALLVQARDQAPGWRSPTAHMEQILADRHSGG
jgi:tetratricopeptide (TPR) repeat protein